MFSDVEIMDYETSDNTGDNIRDEAVGQVGDIRYPDGEIDPLLVVIKSENTQPTSTNDGKNNGTNTHLSRMWYKGA